MRVRSSCSPSAETVTSGSSDTAPPSIVHSILSTPEPVPSEPSTCTVYGVERQPAGGSGVSLTGAVVSTRTVLLRHSDRLPAVSTARVSSVCTPSVSTTAGPPSSIVPLSTRHSIVARPDVASVPVRGNASASGRHVGGRDRGRVHGGGRVDADGLVPPRRGVADEVDDAGAEHVHAVGRDRHSGVLGDGAAVESCTRSWRRRSRCRQSLRRSRCRASCASPPVLPWCR